MRPGGWEPRRECCGGDTCGGGVCVGSGLAGTGAAAEAGPCARTTPITASVRAPAAAVHPGHLTDAVAATVAARHDTGAVHDPTPALILANLGNELRGRLVTSRGTRGCVGPDLRAGDRRRGHGQEEQIRSWSGLRGCRGATSGRSGTVVVAVSGGLSPVRSLGSGWRRRRFDVRRRVAGDGPGVLRAAVGPAEDAGPAVVGTGGGSRRRGGGRARRRRGGRADSGMGGGRRSGAGESGAQQARQDGGGGTQHLGDPPHGATTGSTIGGEAGPAATHGDSQHQDRSDLRRGRG